MINDADISENQLLHSYGEKVCMNLLKDHTTQQNIYWATDSYADYGEDFTFFAPITLDKITSYASKEGKVITKEQYNELVKKNPEEKDNYQEIIRPRAVKSKEEQTQRAKSVIKLNDKELGTIIAQGFVESIAQHAGGTNAYNVNLRPVIKCDIKDNKVRVTYTVPFYSVNVAVGGGWMGAMGGTIPTRSDQNWTLDKCYPFAKKDSHKKTSCKALVMAHAYSNVVMDKIEECIKNGLSGNENDNW